MKPFKYHKVYSYFLLFVDLVLELKSTVTSEDMAEKIRMDSFNQ
jgi:hypothetical protein